MCVSLYPRLYNMHIYTVLHRTVYVQQPSSDNSLYGVLPDTGAMYVHAGIYNTLQRMHTCRPPIRRSTQCSHQRHANGMATKEV